MSRISPLSFVYRIATRAAVLAAAVAAPLAGAADVFHSYAGWSHSSKAELERNGPQGEIAVNAYTFGLVEKGDWMEGLEGSYGLVWRLFDFDAAPGILLPEQLQSLSLDISAEIQLSPKWWVRGTVSPGVYAQELRFNSKAVNAPGTFLMTFAPNPELELLIGAGFNYFASHRVIPLAGLRWAISETWALSVGLPRTGLAYAPSERLLVHLGATAQGGSYRVQDFFALPDPDAPPATTLLDYREIRVGVTLDYAISEHLSINLDGGWVAHRRFEYFRREYRLSHQGGAAYGGISFTNRF